MDTADSMISLSIGRAKQSAEDKKKAKLCSMQWFNMNSLEISHNLIPIWVWSKQFYLFHLKKKALYRKMTKSKSL